MSLIQEALKRQQQETGEIESDSPLSANPPAPEIPQPNLNPAANQNQTAQQQPAPTPPPPPPVEPPEESEKKSLGLADKGKTNTPEHAIEPEFLKYKKEEKKSSPWIKLIIFTILLLFIIGLASWMVFYAVQNFTNPKQPAKKQPKTVNKIEKKIEEETTKIHKEKKNTDTNKTSIFEHLLKKAETLPPPPTNTESQKAPIRWPKLKISGAMALKSGQGQAIINGKYICIGEEIEGVTLKKINGNQLTLQYKGETKTVNVGTSL